LRSVSEYLQVSYDVSERRSCRIINLNRATKRHKPQNNRDNELTKEICFLSEKYPRFGYRKIYNKLKEAGWKVGRERVRLIRKQEGLQVIKKQKKKRLLGKSTAQLSKAEYPNRFRCLTVIDEYTRYGLTIHAGRSITSGYIQRILQELFAQWGTPSCLKSDNGPEFIAKEIQRWLKQVGVKTRYIDPDSPWHNGIFRDGCLDRWQFYSVQEARRVISSWLKEYNTERPHGALAGVPPARYVEQLKEKDRKAA